ncbi:hypothetical protein [Plantactinospora sonchi]|uniref:DNA-binding transcriptional regulator of glucitol operon n=1 Tax=Plantactinospora sonchi TaxID=1544735 RepID=A0ABU7RLM6_9ACTN
MRRLWTPAWIVRHVLTVVMVVGFLALGWWQISRAIAGNTLSWAYAVEWPIFAGFLIFLWVREVRYTLHGDRTTASGPDGTAAGPEVVATRTATADPTPSTGIRRPVRATRRRLAGDGGDDPALAEYNHYLAWLNANPGARPADYPGYPGPAGSRKDTSWAQP